MCAAATGVLLFPVLLAAPSLGAVVSTFDTDAQGWTTLTADSATAGLPVQVTAAAVFQPTGGNPGGFISFLDPDGFDSLFRAPASFLGNQTSVLGGSLSFDTITDQAIDYNGPDVVIKGNGTVLVYDVAPPVGTGIWSHVSVSLAPSANWHLNSSGGPAANLADFQSALGAVSELWVTAEYHNGTTEITGLDNVTLTAIPEPGAMLLTMSCGGIGVLSLRIPRNSTPVPRSSANQF